MCVDMSLCAHDFVLTMPNVCDSSTNTSTNRHTEGSCCRMATISKRARKRKQEPKRLIIINKTINSEYPQKRYFRSKIRCLECAQSACCYKSVIIHCGFLGSQVFKFIGNVLLKSMLVKTRASVSILMAG